MIALWLLQGVARTCWSPRTTDRRSLQPTKPSVLWLGGPQAPDKCVLSVCVRLPKLHHPHGRNQDGPFRRHAMEKRGWHPPQAARQSRPDPSLSTARWWQPWRLLPDRRVRPRSQWRIPVFPEPPLSRTQLDGGQRNRENGHNDTDVRREGEGSEDDATRSPCTGVGQCESRNLMDWR